MDTLKLLSHFYCHSVRSYLRNISHYCYREAYGTKKKIVEEKKLFPANWYEKDIQERIIKE